MGTAARQQRLKDDLRVSRVRDAADRMGMPGGQVVDPATHTPISGNTKLSSLRDRYGERDITGAPRVRVVRSDATVRAGERAVEAALGLPEGCFRVLSPDGSDTRGNKRVGNHRAAWGS